MKKEKGFGLILSGGGARGAYQVGVWKAIKELNLPVRLKAVAGVSIGAVNGALIIQELASGRKDFTRDRWQEASPGAIFSALPDHLESLEWSHYFQLGLDTLKHFKVRIEPFKKRMFEDTQETLIRESGIRLVIAAWNLGKIRTEVFRLEDIPEGKLAQYIVASASFPAFGPEKIGTQYYLDGGIGNNLPLQLIMDDPDIEWGLAVDVASFLRYRPSQFLIENRYKDRVFFIRPGRSIPSPADFSREAAQEMLEVGYSDGKEQLKGLPHFLADKGLEAYL